MSVSSLPARKNSAASRFAASRSGLGATAAAAAELLEEGDRLHAGIANDARDLLLTEIEPDPEQPRRHFAQADLDALAKDIRERGVLQPVLVRPPLERGGKYRLVAGERRWRASAIAGKVRIPARIREMSDSEVRPAQLVENILREPLSDIEKGRALRALYEIRKSENSKTTWEDVAAEVGLGRARIHDLYNLASLPTAVGALIDSGRLSGSHGIALFRAQEKLGEDEVIALAQEAARSDDTKLGGAGMSVAKLRNVIQERMSPPVVSPAAAQTVPEIPLQDIQHIQDIQPAVAATTVNTPAASGAASGESKGAAINGPKQALLPAKFDPNSLHVQRTVAAIRTGAISAGDLQALRAALAEAEGADSN